jgi:hypothetical protein
LDFMLLHLFFQTGVHSGQQKFHHLLCLHDVAT